MPKSIQLGLFLMIFALTACNRATQPPVVTVSSASDSLSFLDIEIEIESKVSVDFRGVCWSEGTVPDITDHVAYDSTLINDGFRIKITGLTNDTEYTLRGFASNEAGIGYSEPIVLTTSNGNYKEAYEDSNGCLICDEYSIGESFVFNGNSYSVVGRDELIQKIANDDDLSLVCTSKINDFSGLFRNEVVSSDITDWDVSNGIDFTEMFRGSTFNQDISRWDMAFAIDLTRMFWETSIFNQPINTWDVSSVVNMSGMFGFSNFNQPLNDWNTQNVVYMDAMFRNNSLFNGDVSAWDVSNVQNMSLMFHYSTSFNQIVSNWNTSNVVNMANMFEGGVFNIDIGNWDVESVNQMDYMFNNNNSFNQDLSDWCVTSIVTLPNGFATGSLHVNYYPIWGTCP